ncbi:MAG: serine protease [Hyphomicrobiales bacterium]|nr:MAG: serine protease [Hyphomicrobiales bacterium]
MGASAANAETAAPGTNGAAEQPAVVVGGNPAHMHGPRSVADLAEGLIDAVVNISTTQVVSGQPSVPTPAPDAPKGSPFEEFFEEFFNRPKENDQRPRKVQSLGSGFIIDGKEGLIITNNHVIEEADEIVVNLNDGTKLTAELVGRDTKTDLALLKVETDKPLTELAFGDSDKLRVGDWVMAIGNPFNLGGTVTVGIVSARNRDINSGPYDNYIQTDAAINRGNSGGPLFDMNGKVVGINTAIFSPSGGSIGIGFAVPSAIAMNVFDQLRQYGETRRGWLGVRIQQVTDEIAEGLGMESPRGALVAGVTEDGPAAKAGLEPGDVIITFDGRDVPAMRDLPRMVAESPIGKAVDVLILRKGKEVTLQVELGRLEESESTAEPVEEVPSEPEEAVTTVSVLGMTVVPLSDQLRATYSIGEEVMGVVITDVAAGSVAAEKNVVAGDVIVEVGQEAITEPGDVAERVKQLTSEGRRSILLLLSNGRGELRFVALRVEK